VDKPDETIDATCPSCGHTKLAFVAGEFWDGWSLSNGRAASGITVYGRCHGCGAVLQGGAEDGEEGVSRTWSLVDEDAAKMLERFLSG
jgi:hypothetical protein